MQSAHTTQSLEREVFFNESAFDTGLYEVKSSYIFFDKINYSAPDEILREGPKTNSAPVYFKSVPLENTGSHLCPLGA